MTRDLISEPPYSTDAEVAKLMKKGETLKEGDVVEHKELAKLTGAPYKTTRYWTIVQRWKTLMQNELNKVLKAKMGVGYVVLNPPGRVSFTADMHRSAMKKVRRAVGVAVTTPDEALSLVDKMRRDHYIKVCAAHQALAQVERKQLTIKVKAVRTKELSE